MDVTTTVGPLQVPLDVTFGDLWDKMKFAASGHYEGSNGTWGFLLDAMYVNLGEDGVTVIESPGPGENELLADYRFKTYLAEGAALWSPFESGSSRFDFLGGVRYVRQDLTLDFTSTGPSEPGPAPITSRISESSAKRSGLATCNSLSALVSFNS